MTHRAIAIAVLAFCITAARADGPGPAADPAALDRSIAATRDALRLAGSDGQRAAIARQLADLSIRRARLYAGAGQADLAIETYERALDAVPSHPVALVELGFLQLAQGRPERARGLADAALARDPDNPYALELRGEILYRDNRLDDALADLHRAAALRPKDGDLAARIAKIEREQGVEREYRRADSAHFVLRFDGARDEKLGAALLDALERAMNDLEREIGPGSTVPTTVILYTSRAFHETTGTDEDVVGLFDGKVRLPVGGLHEVTPAVVRVVRHELTHALLHARGHGAVPRWLHEGLAQLMEPRDPARADADVRREGRAALEPFSYPRALSFVAWLDREYGRARLLWAVDLLAQGKDEASAMRDAFAYRPDELVEAWGRWLSGRS